jgi:tetratricopeptide (TPR) repeat protein
VLLFKQADEFYRQGRIDKAAMIYRKIIALDPAHADALHRLGVIAFKQGRHAEALDHIAAAAAIRPNDARLLSDLGLVRATVKDFEGALSSLDAAIALDPIAAETHGRRADVLRGLGRLDDALRACDAALAAGSGQASILNNRGLALIELGRPLEALGDFERALEIAPDYPPALCNRGRAQQMLGRPDDALASYDAALALDPNHAESLNNRGVVLQARDRLEEAVASFERAVAVAPGMVGAWVSRAAALWRLDHLEPALGSLDAALALDPRHVTALNMRGLILVALNRPAQALESYDLALAADPSFADALGNKGLLLAELGRADEARAVLEQAIALAPTDIRAHYNLTLWRRTRPDDAHFQALRDMAQDMTSLTDDRKIHLHYALGKAFADVGDPARSFQHLLAGSALKRDQVVYDEAATLAGFERLRDQVSQGLIRERAGLGAPSPAPVFILGMPRSGTTLVEQILASHSQVFAAGETSAFAAAARALEAEAAIGPTLIEAPILWGPEQLRRLGEIYLSKTRADAARVTNKTPDNFRFVGLIHLALPGARIIHVRRDPIDTCLSCFSKLFGGDLPYTYDLAELGRYYRAYDALMAHWTAVLPPGVMLEVRYEDIVADLESQARRLVAHCGLDWEPACLDYHQTERWVHTASASQVREPIYRTAIGRSRPPRDVLRPLIDALGAVAGRDRG